MQSEDTSSETAKPGMHDRLTRYVQVFDDAMSPAFCAQMVAGFQQMEKLQTPNGRGHRAGLDDSAWTELDITPFADQAMQGFFYDQIDRHLARYNQTLGLTIGVPSRPNLEALRIKRYRVGQDEKFQPHFDAIDAKANRYLVFLWYLNDVAEGGETLFCDLDVRVAPKVGRLLVFPPYWMFQHAGLPPLSNDKYIVSTYLLF
jgi:prolyl 4-hydroxylase